MIKHKNFATLQENHRKITKVDISLNLLCQFLTCNQDKIIQNLFSKTEKHTSSVNTHDKFIWYLLLLMIYNHWIILYEWVTALMQKEKNRNSKVNRKELYSLSQTTHITITITIHKISKQWLDNWYKPGFQNRRSISTFLYIKGSDGQNMLIKEFFVH